MPSNSPSFPQRCFGSLGDRSDAVDPCPNAHHRSLRVVGTRPTDLDGRNFPDGIASTNEGFLLVILDGMGENIMQDESMMPNLASRLEERRSSP